jgi:hypothetical protein
MQLDATGRISPFPGSRLAGPAGEPTRSARLRIAMVLSRLIALFLLFDGAARIVLFTPYVEGLVLIGYPAWLGPAIGASLIVSVVLYLVRQTAILGAVLVTGYLGGAAASQVRLEDPWFLFPVALAVILWGYLWLREPRLRELLPLVS